MRLRGRRHWTSTVSIATGVRGTGPDAGATIWTDDPTRADLQAAVQSMDRESIVRHSLSTDQEHFWVRLDEAAAPLRPLTNALVWNDRQLVITSVNHVPGEDIELIATAAN